MKGQNKSKRYKDTFSGKQSGRLKKLEIVTVSNYANVLR